MVRRSSLPRLATVLALISLPQIVSGATCGKTHVVASGEGCWSIFTDAKLTQAQFLGINPGLDCNVLQLGQQVCVAVSCSKFYTVVSGDWCAKIESDQGISEASMMSLNPGLNCNEIFAGQSICVAAPASTPTQTTTSVIRTSTAIVTSTQPTSTAVPNPSTVECGRSVPVIQGDTCYGLATSNGLQLPQFEAINPGLNCSTLQAGDTACIRISCGEIYKVQSGDWCAKIESDFGLSANQLTMFNPGLSCNDLAPTNNVCIQPAVKENLTSTYTPPIDLYPALSPGTTVLQSPILAFASVEGNARSTFYGETIFQSDSQHLDAFTHNDLNNDGKLDRNELQTMMSMDPSVLRGISEVNNTLNAGNLVSEMIKSADLNKDGSIDKEEFLFAIRQVQNATTAVTEIANDNTALGKHRKRFIPFIIAGIAAIIGLVIADVTLFFQILARNEKFRGNDLLSYLDITYWDGNGSPPSCSAYLYWSTQCGAIGSGWAKGCSGGGTRVFGDSCVTHFNSGSAGCGFLGCKSLCYNFNLDDCSCDALKYEAERETEYTDTPYSTSNEKGVGACRTKCGSTSGCVGFSVSPGNSDTTLSCKIFKSLTNKKSNSKYTTFRVSGSPTGSQCPPLAGTEYTPWPSSVMADDYTTGEKLTEEYTQPSSKKRSLDEVDRRKDPKFATKIKSQSQSACGLCAPFSFTTAVEGTHKVWMKGYEAEKELSPVWVGRCKGKQSCDAGAQGGRHIDLINAVGNDYIHLEECNPTSTAASPNCKASCAGGRILPYVTGHKEWSLSKMDPEDKTGREKALEEVKIWLEKTGPILASICMGSAWTAYIGTTTMTGPDIVFYNGDSRWKSSKDCGSCNHGVTIVGYKHIKRGTKNRIVWIIHNSFGRSYGMGGYQLIEHGSASIHTSTWYGLKVKDGVPHDET